MRGDKRAPGGQTETPISKFLIARKQSVEINEAYA